MAKYIEHLTIDLQGPGQISILSTTNSNPCRPPLTNSWIRLCSNPRFSYAYKQPKYTLTNGLCYQHHIIPLVYLYKVHKITIRVKNIIRKGNRKTYHFGWLFTHTNMWCQFSWCIYDIISTHNIRNYQHLQMLYIMNVQHSRKTSNLHVYCLSS